MVARNLSELALIAADQHDDGELATKDGHLAVFDVAPAARYELRDLLDEADAIRSDGSQDQMLFFFHAMMGL